MSRISLIETISRMLEIIKLMARNEGTTLTEISEKTGIDRWTAKNMINDMENLNSDGKGLYIQEFKSTKDKRNTIYKISKDNLWTLTLPGMNLTDDEGLLMALMFSQSESNTMLRDSAQGLKKKLNMFKNMQSYQIISVSEAKKIAKPETKQIIINLLDSINNDRCIYFDYKPLQSETVKTYLLLPLGIFRYETGYYLAAQKLPEGQFRTFGLERVESMPQLAIYTGKRPEKIDYKDRLADPFGPFDHIEEFEAELKFDSFYGLLNMELSWPEAVKIEQKNDSSIVMVAKTRSHSGIREFILKYGSNVRVLKPEWLKDEIKAELKKTLDNYT